MTPEELQALKRDVIAAAESIRSTLLYAALGVALFFMLSRYAKR